MFVKKKGMNPAPMPEGRPDETVGCCENCGEWGDLDKTGLCSNDDDCRKDAMQKALNNGSAIMMAGTLVWSRDMTSEEKIEAAKCVKRSDDEKQQLSILKRQELVQWLITDDKKKETSKIFTPEQRVVILESVRSEYEAALVSAAKIKVKVKEIDPFTRLNGETLVQFIARLKTLPKEVS